MEQLKYLLCPQSSVLVEKKCCCPCFYCGPCPVEGLVLQGFLELSCCILVVAWALQEPDTHLLSSLLQGYEGSLIKLTSKQVPPSSLCIFGFCWQTGHARRGEGKNPISLCKALSGPAPATHQGSECLHVFSCCPG